MFFPIFLGGYSNCFTDCVPLTLRSSVIDDAEPGTCVESFFALNSLIIAIHVTVVNELSFKKICMILNCIIFLEKTHLLIKISRN